MNEPDKDASALQDSVSLELAAWIAELGDVTSGVEAARQRVAKLARLLERNLVRIAAENGLAMGDWEALSVLQRSGPPYEASPKALAAELRVTSGTMSVRIERLSKNGLVEPGAPRPDRRSRPVRLTRKGQRRWRTATEQRTVDEQRLIGGTLTPHQLDRLNALLASLLARFEAELGRAPRHGTGRSEAS